MATAVSGLLRLGFNTVFQPSALIGSRARHYTGSLKKNIREFTHLIAVYFVSLLVYAVPLTYAGLGAETVPNTVPSRIEEVAIQLGMNPELMWLYTILFIENCAYIFAASVLTLTAFHSAMIFTHNSAGILQSIRTITYSTGIYLAFIFSFAWYLSISDQIVVADEWLIALQLDFIYFIMDAANVALDIPGPRLAAVDTSAMGITGKLVIAGLFISGCYYLYSLYLGARINHQSSRITSVIAVALVAITPIPYAIGFVVLLEASQLNQFIPGLLL